MDWIEFVRLYLSYTIKLCRLNLANGRPGAEFGPSVRLAALPVWSHLVELFYFYFSLKLLACQMLQHHYHALQQAIAHIAPKAPAQGHSPGGPLETQLQRVVARFEWLGNAYYECGFAMEPLFVYLLTVAFMIYVQARLFSQLCGPIQFGVLQLLWNPAREHQQVTGRDITRQVDQFAKSSREFASRRREEVPPGGGSERHLELLELEWAHERAVSLARELAHSKRLVPPNRSQENLPRLAAIYGALVAASNFSGLLCVLAIVLALPHSGLLAARAHNWPWQHLLFQVEIVLHCLVTVQHITFYLVTGFMAVYEQLMFVDELAREVASLTEDTCLASSPATCREVPAGSNLSKATTPPGSGGLSGRLLRLLILYKLLLGQMRLSQPPVGYIGAHLTLVMLAIPMLNRLYVAHLSRQIRWIMLAASLFIIFSCDFIIMPNCTLHARCRHLFRAMSHLLARIDAHEAHCCGRRSAFDAHTVWLLRSEQNAPELALERFATNALLLRLTYSSLLRVNFWCGLLLAPMVFRNSARLGATSSGNLLADTLRLF